MKLENTTDWSDAFLRRMLAWCCKEIGMPVRTIKDAHFRNSRSRFGGRARGWRKQISVCVSKDASDFPWTDNGKSPGIIGIVRTYTDRLECLVGVTAHEAYHVAACHVPDLKQKTRRRKSYGSSERITELAAQKVLAAFRINREFLLQDWSEQRPKQLEAKAQSSLIEKRAEKALKDLARWETKLKRAKTAVRKYKARVQYYQKKQTVAATSSQGTEQ